MNFITGLRCVICQNIWGTDTRYTCPRCGNEGILDVLFDYDKIKPQMSRAALADRQCDVWRYRELLPILPDAERPLVHLGWTPIYDSRRLAAEIDIAKLFIKDEGRNPTASFKDRASAIGVMKARQFGFDAIACASTGNAASSLAGMAAAMNLRSYIFVPKTAPEPKVAQLLIFGATVLKVNGLYEAAYDLCMAACEKYGWYNRNCAINPYLVEGKKTAGLEIAEQMTGSIPDWVAVSVGDGCTIAGVWKGLWEMHQLGIIDRLPKMLGVQAEGAAPIFTAFHQNKDLRPIAAATIADSICVGTPRNWRKAINALRASGGTVVTVSDAQILEALRLCARQGGVFGEPAGVTSLAGLKAARRDGILKSSEAALVVVTGNGLKDVQSAMKAASPAHVVEPNLESLDAVLV
jgi:threonine synthase